ncbi:MAG: CRISPR-associated endonuclease Cas2 [Neomegalonema sp.]|nr:CRISPR-associated endonuclease Cas2 [Neomegalonema sp.]
MRARRAYLIAYDIRSPKRLRAVHRFVSQRAYRLQYSLYVIALTPRGLERMTEALRRRIDEAVDDVRIYPIPEPPRGAWFGPLPEAEGIMLLGNPAAELARRLKEKAEAQLPEMMPDMDDDGGDHAGEDPEDFGANE